MDGWIFNGWLDVSWMDIIVVVVIAIVVVVVVEAEKVIGLLYLVVFKYCLLVPLLISSKMLVQEVQDSKWIKYHISHLASLNNLHSIGQFWELEGWLQITSLPNCSTAIEYLIFVIIQDSPNLLDKFLTKQSIEQIAQFRKIYLGFGIMYLVFRVIY